MLSNTGSILSALVLVTLAGCESARPRVGQSARVDFGIVRVAEPVTLNSTAAEGALLGGTLGLMAGGRRNPAVGAAIGGAVGGAAGAAAGGDRSGMSYTVELAGGSTRIVTDQREIRVGDCVAVERVGQGANIRRVEPAYCQPAYAQALRAVEAPVKSAAVQCENARQELSRAASSDAAELATRKIELLCNG